LKALQADFIFGNESWFSKPLPYPILATEWDRDDYLQHVLAEIRSTGKFVSGQDYPGNDYHNGSVPLLGRDYRKVDGRSWSRAQRQQAEWEKEQRERRETAQRIADIQWRAEEIRRARRARVAKTIEECTALDAQWRARLAAEAAERDILELHQLQEDLDALVPYEPYIAEDA
jgi:hypothetical protein